MIIWLNHQNSWGMFDFTRPRAEVLVFKDVKFRFIRRCSHYDARKIMNNLIMQGWATLTDLEGMTPALLRDMILK